MKNKILIIAALVGTSITAFANDGGTPYIKIDSIKTKIHRGQSIELSGGDLDKLYQILPKDYVYDVSRSLTITSNNRSVVISCKAEALDENAEDPVRNPKTTKCTIYYTNAFDPDKSESDSSVFEPPRCEKK
jgi:hypothetical protein